MKKLISNFVRIAKEGLTIDGRTITAEQLSQMAASYDPQTYGARIWLEHFRSLFADGAFPALGDVTELKTDKDSDGKLVLLAKLQPNDKLLEMNKQGQKVFTSIEMDPNFTDSGQAYLVGLGVTDTPASTGVDRLTFTQEGINKFADDNQKGTKQIWPYLENDALTFSEEEDGQPSANPGPSIFSKVQEILSGTSKRTDQRFNDMEQGMVELAKSVDALNQTVTDLSSAGSDEPKSPDAGLVSKVETLSTQLSDLTTKLTGEPAPGATARPESQGFNRAEELTDS